MTPKFGLILQPKRQSAKAKPHQLRATGGQGSNALRVLKTSDVPIPGMPPAQDPTGSRTIVPNSLELLSYPMPSFMAAGSSQDPARAAARQHYGVRLRVANSGWTNPLALDTVEVAGTSPAAATPAVGNLQNAQPVLLRAEVRENNVVYEVIARLEVTAFKNSQVLRLEPHVVVTNRTAVPLQLLQCRTAAPAPLAAAASGVVVVPEGGVSFTYGASRGINALPVAGPGSHLMRPSMRSAGSLARLSPSAVSVQDSLQQHGSMSSAGSQAWLPVPSAMSARSLVQLSGNSMRSLEQNGAILDLPAGASAVPLHLIPGLQYHVLCFRYAGQLPGAGTVSTAQGLPLWSRPLHLQQDREEQHYVVIPVAADNASAQSQLLGAEGVALLRLTMHTRGAGAMHIVLESVNSEPPFLLENRTPFPVQYRQADIPTAPFHTLEPMSAVGYAWEYSLSGVAAPEIEFQEGLAVGAAVVRKKTPSFNSCRVRALGLSRKVIMLSPLLLNVQRYQLESPEGGDSGSNGVARCRPLPLSVSPHQCTVRVGFAEAVATNSEGVVAITGDSAGGALGRGGIERVLQLAPGRDSLLLAGLKGLAAPPPDFHATFELPGVEVSLIDDTPMEILLLTVTGLKVVVASGLTPVGPYRSVRCSIGRLQLDNQLPGARFPVAFSLAKNASSSLPQLSLMAVTQVAGMRGRTFFPFIGAHSPDELQLAVAESLVWRVAAVADTVMQRAGAGNAGGPDTAAADIPVRIRLLNVPDIGCNVSFLGEPLSRPRHMAGGVVSLIIDLASFQAAPVTLHGLDMSNISTSRSAFFNQIFQVRFPSVFASITCLILSWPSDLLFLPISLRVQIIQGELFGITLSLVRNFGVIGGASKVLGILSAGVAKLAGDRRASGALGQEDAPPQQTPQRSITDVGDGLLEGAGAFGSSLLRGFKGLVEKPMQGAKQSGVEGAFRGMAKGLVGVVATPVSGALDALSATAEGFDASFGKSKEELLVVERRRLPRVIGGDGKLQPILREGSDREANIEQLGQALLRATLLAEASSLAQLQRLSVLECYEEHFVLPGDAVAILTNRSLLLVFAPGFATLDGAAEVGALATVDVPAGRLQWRVSWSDLLAMELRWSSAGKYPDRIVVHRRGLPGVTESQPLANLISCFPDTPQASQIKLVAGKVLRKYYQDPARKDQQWSERHEARARLPADQPPEHLPLTLPSLGFTPTWHTNPARAPVVYFWRAEAPSGYKPVGDVATLGDEPPLHPVPCFRDDSTLQAAAAAMLQGTSFDGSSAQARPVAVPPEEFTLIWRYNGPRAVTMWMPVAPPGYKALGAVVLDGPNVPSVDDYLCVREDLCRGTNVFDSPIWAYDPAPVLAAAAAAAQQHGGKAGPSNAMVPKPGGQTHQPETWKVTVWPVDSRLGTFLVVRGLSRPPQEVALTVAQVEDKPGRLLG